VSNWWSTQRCNKTVIYALRYTEIRRGFRSVVLWQFLQRRLETVSRCCVKPLGLKCITGVNKSLPLSFSVPFKRKITMVCEGNKIVLMNRVFEMVDPGQGP
jgi:hypothetical protein